jgi:outer membrane protein TolC
MTVDAKLDRGYSRLEAARIAVLFGWCLLLYELTACPCPALAQEPLVPIGSPTRRRQPVPNSAVLQEPQAPVTLVVDQNLSPTGEPRQAGEQLALTAPAAEPGEEVLPINLPSALRLANAQAWDIAIAVQQWRIASAQLQGANVLWVPSIIGGVDYVHHDGPFQKYVANGDVSDTSFSSLYPGMAPLAVFASTDAIFMPLAQRQVTRAQRANVQTATNDTLTSLAVTYFNAVEARADLAGIDDVVRRMEEMVRTTVVLAREGMVPDLEMARVRAALASAEEVRETARQRWRVASAEVARVVRLKPTVLIEPMESPLLQVTLIPPQRSPDELIPLAIQNRPELTFNQAQVEAARHRMSQEKWRPFLPIFLARGSGSQFPYPMAFGAFGGGTGATLSNFGVRSDFDLEAIWELRNLGFGNRALIRQRQADFNRARIEAFRIRDIVTKEVTQVWADLQSASQRIIEAERELRQALLSAKLNLKGMSETKRVAGNIRELVIRPLEVVVALQVLNKAYYHYFAAIADYNRGQFRLYRALGNPAQALTVPKNPSMPAATGEQP